MLPGRFECPECDARGRWFVFDPRATTEAASHILIQCGGTMDRRKLIMMLYLADVAMLREHGRSITGAKWYCASDGVTSPDIEQLMGVGIAA